VVQQSLAFVVQLKHVGTPARKSKRLCIQHRLYDQKDDCRKGKDKDLYMHLTVDTINQRKTDGETFNEELHQWLDKTRYS
jgi:hypothetical protein